MSVTIEVSEAVHEVLEAHRRENESLEETIKRLLGGPHPETLAQVVGTDAEDADVMRAAIERRRAGSRERRSALRERTE